MIDWLEHARQTFAQRTLANTPITVKRALTTVLKVPEQGSTKVNSVSIDSNDSDFTESAVNTETLTADFEERAAIMEFDGNLPRDEAERQACQRIRFLYNLSHDIRLN